MSAPETTAGPGRPKSREKREQIIAAAQQLFLESGFEATSVDSVAALAGVSKATVYSHFDGKLGLFSAVVAARSDSSIDRLKESCRATENPRADLIQFAMNLSRVVLTPEHRPWDRLVIAEADRHPELARELFEAGPKLVHEQVAICIATHVGAGRLTADDPSAAAETLIGLVLGFEYVRSLMASQPRRDDAFMRRRAEDVVDLFLARHGAPRGVDPHTASEPGETR
ncbi:MAG: TetR/AcrR family transcriptional regulator [Planctomycetota bacterium]